MLKNERVSTCNKSEAGIAYLQTPDGSLKKTPLSAKDRIKHLNEKISTEQASDSLQAPPRTRNNRESRLVS